MGDRSDEATADPRSTEELLEETERLLSESGGSSDGRTAERARDEAVGGAGTLETSDEGSSGPWWRSGTADGDDGADAVAGSNSVDESSSGRSWLSGLRPSLPVSSPTAYFSPKAFLALVLAIGAGFFAGNLVLPIAGSFVGIFAAAFLIGLATSKRRYLEVAAAGSSVGIVTALADFAVLAFVVGYSGRVVAIGATTGLLACLFGYYFGRDFRDGLVRDVE